MERIRSLVGMARRRLFLQEWLSASMVAAVVACALLLLVVLERRLFGLSAALGVPSRSAAWLLGAAIMLLAVAALVGWLRVHSRMRSESDVALELDARIRSGERLSTALALAADEGAASDPFARAAIADAVAFAGDPLLAGRTREAFPVQVTGRWWIAPALLGLAIVAWMTVPQRETAAPPGKDDVVRAAERKQTPEEKRLEELVKQVERSPELAAKLDAELEMARRTLDEGARGPVRSPEDAARESLRRMAEMEQRLAEVSGSKESKASRELQDALAKLELPKDQNAARDLAEALKQGDFEAAKKAVAELQKAAAASDLSKEDREKLAKSLEDTSKQLESLAKDPSKLAEALKSAGMDPALANNPAALQQAIAQSKDLNESQKQSIQKMAQSIKDAQQQLGQMSQKMDQMAQQCKNPGQQGPQSKGQQGEQGQQAQQGEQGQQAEQSGDQGKQGESGKEGDAMTQMLDKAETDRQMAKAADDAGGKCQGGGDSMSESDADSALRASSESEKGRSAGAGGKQGSGNVRQEGASGGDRKIRETAFGTKFQKQKGPKQDGDVIARQLVAGQSPTGESRVGLEQVAGTIAAGYEKGSEDDPVPAHLRDVHKQYFGDLRKKFDERGVQPAKPAGGAAPAPAAPPAAPGAGAGNGG
jgi:hypothetical protein